MELTEDRIIHRFIKDIAEYEQGGEYFNQVIPADTQAYAIYPAGGEKVGLYYVLGDDVHTYTEIRAGSGSKKSAKEYPVFTQDDVNTINKKADKSYVDTEFNNAEKAWTALVNAEKSRAEGAENTIAVALNDETARAVLEEDKLDKKIDAEINRATNKENNITSDLNTHKNNKNNPHDVTKAQVGLGNCDNTSDINKPISKLTQDALDNLSKDLGDETDRAIEAEQLITNNLSNHKNDKNNPHSVTKSQVGLGNVDNVSDINKPISSATQKALDNLSDDLSNEVSRATNKENEINNSFIAHKNAIDNPHSVTKVQVGLSNVDNTSDLNKPVSTAVQTELDKKADKTSVYTKQEIDSKLTSAFIYKGTVATEANLPKTNNKIGDIYNVDDTGSNYAWNGTDWDKLSETIDLSPYLTISSAENTYATKNELTNGLNLKLNTADLTGVGLSNDYNDITNKPSVNNVVLEGNKTLEDLGIQPVGNYALKSELPTKVSELVNDSGYLTTHQDISGKADLSYVNNELNKKQDAGDYALKSEIPAIPTNISEFTNDAGYLTEIPDDYLTVEEASSVYALAADLESKADKSELPVESQLLAGDIITILNFNGTTIEEIKEELNTFLEALRNRNVIA